MHRILIAGLTLVAAVALVASSATAGEARKPGSPALPAPAGDGSVAINGQQIKGPDAAEPDQGQAQPQ